MSDAHASWMMRAIELAAQAAEQGEVPVGAVVVQDQQIIGEGFNQVLTHQDPSAHAEIQALRQAGKHANNYRLQAATMYVTLEPCLMCAGAILHARLQRLVFGAQDEKAGAVCSSHGVLDSAPGAGPVPWQGGVQASACADLLKQFFAERRA